MRHSDNPPSGAGLTPEGTFVIQLHADSDARQRRLRGRVEHVMSGESEPFASLAELLAFMARYANTGCVAPTLAKKKEEPDGNP